MAGNRAQRRILALLDAKSVSYQRSHLLPEEKLFLYRVASSPGSKLNGGEASNPLNDPMWPKLERLGLIEVVGSYKWKPTAYGARLAKRLFGS